MSCGCSSVHTPPTLTSCNATYNVCTGKSFYINVTGCTNPIVTIPTQSQQGYPIVGLLEYSEINKKIYYTHNGSNSGVATSDSFTYSVECNGTVKTCTITVNIDDSISVDTTVVELDGCCIPTYTAKIYGISVNSIIVDNVNIIDMSYVSDVALSLFLNNYIGVNGTFTVVRTVVSGVINWTISLASNTKVLNSVTGATLVQGIKTLCGCAVGDVEYTWCIPECATLLPGYSVHDCKIQVIVPLYDTEEDACCPIDLTVRCGSCVANCEKTETYNWCPPIYENCTTPDCTLYPCTSYNPISGNCDSICDECDTCCQNEGGYYCAECCDATGCVLVGCTEESQPLCVGGECLCYINGEVVPALPNGCCPNCTEETVIPNCHTCINGVIVPPDTTCTANKVYNYETCQCECDCQNGYCYNTLTQNCVPCPVCAVIPGIYTCNGVPYMPTLTACTQCVDNVIVPVQCASGFIPNPYFNNTQPASQTNPCCISIQECDCENPDCTEPGSICTHIDGSENCYCVDCTELSCTNNTNLLCEQVNGCQCVTNTCQSACPTCNGTVTITEYCTPFFVKFMDCSGGDYRFKVFELTELLVKPLVGCSHDDYLSEYTNNPTNFTNITASATISYNTTSSVFFEPAVIGSGNYINIPKAGVQTILIKVVKYGIEVMYEFVLDENTCQLASEDNGGTDLLIPKNPRIFRETCKFIYGMAETCLFNGYDWEFVGNPTDGDTAVEIQDGKYIVIFPPSFTLGTTRQVCVTATYTVDTVICYSKEVCKDYTPCTGGCGCDPCEDSNSGFIANIETINDTLNGTVSASASVLINCNGAIRGLLATCEPASSNESCTPGVGITSPPDHNGTSPLPFSEYSDYITNLNPCSIWGCNETDIGCDTQGQAPCGWMYDETKLEVISYDGASIEVGFVGDNIKGKLCWGAQYECGYKCICKDINKVLTCEDYGLISVNINCPPSPNSPNAGDINISVNNNSTSYKIEVFKVGSPNVLLTTIPSVVTPTYTVPISNTWGIVNTDVLLVKITILNNALDCTYQQSVTYNCCITPTLTGLSALCNENTGKITSVSFTTNVAGNPYDIYINNETTPIESGNTVVGVNTHTFASPLPTGVTPISQIKVKVCDNNTEDCCITVSLPVECGKNCAIEGGDIVVVCDGNIIESITIDGDTGVIGDTYNIEVKNVTKNITVNITAVVLPHALTSGQITTLDIDNGDVITALISVVGDNSCRVTVSETINCEVVCDLVVGNPTQTCHGQNLISLSFPITGGTFPINITGNLLFKNMGAGSSGGDLILAAITDTENTEVPYYTLVYADHNTGAIAGNCITGTLTFTDANDCVDTVVLTCDPCNATTNAFDCVDGFCVKSPNEVGEYPSQESCLQDCENNLLIACGVTIIKSAEVDSLTTASINLSDVEDESTLYLDVAFGGKPEKYTLYQLDEDGIQHKILESPFLGCDCADPYIDEIAPLNDDPKSLKGFWSNVSGLSQSGTYNLNNVASCTSPFTFGNGVSSLTALDYSGLNYDAFVSGGINMGTRYDIIPDNSEWIDHYTSTCGIQSNRDYDTCGTCSEETYEEINAHGLARVYFKYKADYGSILQIVTMHGINGDSCVSGTHGIKYKLYCEDTPMKYSCVTGNCIPDVNGIYSSLNLCNQNCVSVFCESVSSGSTITNENGEQLNPNRYNYYETVYVPPSENPISVSMSVNTNSIFDTDKEILKAMLKLPNVVNYGIGKKISNGVYTGELAYIFGVTHKVDNLKEEDKIPKILNGYKTDVIIVEDIHTLDNCSTTGCSPSPDPNGSCVTLTHRNNHISNTGDSVGKTILRGGISAVRQSGSACTFSLVAKDDLDGKLVGLCCTHCFQCRSQRANVGLHYNVIDYVQTSPYDVTDNPFQRSSRVVGAFKRDVTVHVSTNTSDQSGNNNLVDAAILDINLSSVVPVTDIYQLSGIHLKWATYDEITTAIANDWKIAKSGRTLGTFNESYNFTIDGRLDNVGVHGCYDGSNYIPHDPMVPRFDGVLLVNQPGTKFGTGGDSSSPVLVKNPDTGDYLVAGILFAGSCNRIYLIPMYNIASQLNISAWDGVHVIASNGEPTVTVNGKTLYKGEITNSDITHIKD